MRFYTEDELNRIRKLLTASDFNRDGVIQFDEGNEFINKIRDMLVGDRESDAIHDIMNGIYNDLVDGDHNGVITIDEFIVYLEQIEDAKK